VQWKLGRRALTLRNVASNSFLPPQNHVLYSISVTCLPVVSEKRVGLLCHEDDILWDPLRIICLPPSHIQPIATDLSIRRHPVLPANDPLTMLSAYSACSALSLHEPCMFKYIAPFRHQSNAVSAHSSKRETWSEKGTIILLIQHWNSVH
jgi:hypothetical protein